MVTQLDIQASLAELGIQAGDTVLFHSSLKSFGAVENGADAVIDAFLSAVGEGGTVVVPTLCSRDFQNSYNTWYMDKPSDVGYITEVFRHRPAAKRSNQATHSVAAIGAEAVYLTATHGQSGRRIGVYGDTPFAADSPWQKLYDGNAKVVMVGVGYETFTLRHLCEYMLVEKALRFAEDKGLYDAYRPFICTFETRPLQSDTLFWPYLNHVRFESYIREHRYNTDVTCGRATLSMVHCHDVCEAIIEDAYASPDDWFAPNAARWYQKIKELSK